MYRCDIDNIKINDEKFIKYFSCMYFDAHYHLANSQIKIHLVHGETKNKNCVKSKLIVANGIVYGVK
jgi:hypothetical protein